MTDHEKRISTVLMLKTVKEVRIEARANGRCTLDIVGDADGKTFRFRYKGARMDVGNSNWADAFAGSEPKDA